MDTNMNKVMEDLRADLVRFLPEEILDVIVRDFVGMFAKLREKDDSLGEVLTLRMQDKKEVAAAIEKIRDNQNRTNVGLVEVSDTLENLRPALRSIKEGDGGK